MKWHSARYAIHDAYSVSLKSKNLDAESNSGKAPKYRNDNITCTVVESAAIIGADERGCAP